MKVIEIDKNLKCDTLLCNKNARYQIITNSFKGDNFLCEKCYLELKNLFKRTNAKNEEEK